MPKIEWDKKEQWLTSKERFVEWKEMLLQGEVENVIHQIEDVLWEMEN